MIIKFSPVRHDARLTLNRRGDMLIINGETFDFSGVPDGATLPRAAVDCYWLDSDVERIGGVLHLTLILPHGSAAPPETLFPEPITLTQDGPIAVPAYEVPHED